MEMITQEQGLMDVMNLMEKMKVRQMLKECDFNVAKEIISEKFDLKISSNELSERVEDFLLDPCSKTAMKLINLDPMFTFYFKECCEDGLYVRNKRKQAEAAAETELKNAAESSAEPVVQSAKLETAASSAEESTFTPEPPSSMEKQKPEAKPASPKQPPLSRRIKYSAEHQVNPPSVKTVPVFPNELMTDADFKTVIATLQKDIERLKHEITHTKQEMENDFAKRAEGQQWLEQCEQALQEFREAIRILTFVGEKRGGK